MREVTVGVGGALRLEERPVPEPGPDQVRVAVGYCGVCGTDFHLRETLPDGSVLGHEFSGTVAAVGERVDGWAVGDRVAVLIYGNCGSCRYCRAGSENHCVAGGQRGDVHGVQLPGGFSQEVVVDPSRLFRLPGTVTLEQGALVEPLAVGVHAAAAVDADLDEPVVVLGAGPVGLFTAVSLRARGYQDVVVVERNPVRAELPARLGFATLRPDELGPAAETSPPGCVVECAAAPAAASAALHLLRPQGSLVMVGLPPGDVAFDVETLVLREIRVLGTSGYSRADFARALDLLAGGTVPTDEMVTAVVDLADAEDVFAQLADPGTAHVKVLLKP